MSEQELLAEVERDLNIDDIDFSDLEEQYAVEKNFGLENYVVVDGAPVAPESKAPVLEKVLRKLFSKVAQVVEGDDGIYMPVEGGKTKGYLFVQFKNGEQAEAAIKNFNGKKLDANHKLYLNKLSDIGKYTTQVNDEFVEPEIADFKSHGYLKSWLQDEQGRDQMAMHFSETVGVFWNKKKNEPEAAIEPRKGFTSKYAKFSPRGTYLFSIHPQGIQCWGGEDFHSIHKFVHNQVRLVDFSPNEKYMVTLSPLPIEIPDSPEELARCPFGPESKGHKLVIWDLTTGEPARTFALPPHLEGQKEMPWPLVKWSYDDKYCARQGPDALAIYETPSFQLLDKQLVKIEGIVDFDWAPSGVHLNGSKGESEYVLSYWTPESSNQTARVALMHIPSKKVLRTVNLFQVSDCKMHWQDEGRFMCVKVDRHSKSGKTLFTNLEFFKVTEKDIPVEKLELKDVAINFAWEPKSERFITISNLDNGNTNPAIPRNAINFYAPETTTKNNIVTTKYKLFAEFTDKHSNTILWAPKGRFVVVATITKSNGEIEFFDCNYEDDKTTKKGGKNDTNVKLLRTEKYPGMTNMSWDPSGRFLAAWSSNWMHSIDNGYRLFEFTGNMLREEPIDQFKEFIWRPRPASLLSSADKKTVRKNIKEYSAQFDENDAMEADAATREAILNRKRKLEEWRAYRAHFANKNTKENNVEAEVIEEIKEVIIEEKVEAVEQ
ncbi:Translation initiation factor 3 subunit b [Scheffersomyces spartinae]|uniref:Eukaryotic translation initiation factor 3 subunit B n=1 Tax=Scheffersomyces spartinae TaxID=45513 RepID=A0A9P8AH24_9ASCO|nr:Translation initiation factor 3 subunit b [Scheffersomyces spartinae]KAG7191697.1 Translation initiation factor 3 subunit b [Scheffersomyces spartinae]